MGWRGRRTLLRNWTYKGNEKALSQMRKKMLMDAFDVSFAKKNDNVPCGRLSPSSDVSSLHAAYFSLLSVSSPILSHLHNI
jgi:hypothetical protein